MSKESLGYVQLEWTCPFCNTRNPGPQKKCSNCGAPQPEDVEFHQAAEEEFIEDGELIEQAKAGPDVHCPFCGTRNPAGAETCKQCMADLTDARAREAGRVVGAHKKEAAEPIACEFCGAENEGTAVQCSNCGSPLKQPEPTATKPQPKKQPARSGPNYVLYGILALVLVACGTLAFFYFRTDERVGEVTAVNWERTVEIEGLVPVEHEDWQDEIPEEAAVASCERKLHHTQPQPPADGDATEVCGTPYTVDTGTGVGEVVQDCEYEVYEPWCEYTVEEWQAVDETSVSGAGFSPEWPVLQLSADQREGEQSESYEVVFSVDGETLEYHTSSFEHYTEFEIGSRWTLDVNTFNTVIGVEPVR